MALSASFPIRLRRRAWLNSNRNWRLRDEKRSANSPVRLGVLETEDCVLAGQCLELKTALCEQQSGSCQSRDARFPFAPPKVERGHGTNAGQHPPGLVRVEMRRARMTTAERKADTRRKIQLGGLILKAGLAVEEPAVLLGMLRAGARVLKGPSALESRRRWKEIGDRAFELRPSP
jgi:hypothetical protein